MRLVVPILVAFPGLVAAFRQGPQADLPQQTPTATVDACQASVISLFGTEPTVPAEYKSWLTSVYGTGTTADVCLTTTLTGSIQSVWDSYLTTLQSWAGAHASAYSSLYSECGSYIASLDSAAQSSLGAIRTSCQSKESATATAATTGSLPTLTGGGGPISIQTETAGTQSLSSVATTTTTAAGAVLNTRGTTYSAIFAFAMAVLALAS
ncbi:hypothetical protein BX600DRAFT_477574 [Xylariales sp. PMI_506]|nr:hypothetical protein BX600DRAFT_477574 [Xylariales sp. PMI_506]